MTQDIDKSLRPPAIVQEISVGEWKAWADENGAVCIGDSCDHVCFENEEEYQKFLWALRGVAFLIGWREAWL